MKLFYIIFFLSFYLVLAQTTTDKKELIVFEDDFSEMNWQVLSNSPNDSVNHFTLTPVKYRSGPASLAIFASYPHSQDEWIVSPSMDFSNATNVPLLTFYEDHDFWYQSKGTHEVLYSLVNDPGPEDFQSLIKWTKEDHSIYGFYSQPISVELSGLQGEPNVRIAFRYVSDEDQYDDNWYIDDVKISQNVQFDGTIIYSSLADGSKLSNTNTTNLIVYPQNRGLENSQFPVIADLYDFNKKLLWTDTLETKNMAYLDRDTLQFVLPAVVDSAWFKLDIFSKLSNDQARNNDTLSLELNTYEYKKSIVTEAFLNSQNYYSEGPALIVDSLANLTGTFQKYSLWHYFVESDTLFSESSGDLALQMGINNASTIMLNRKKRYYEPYTYLQDWAKQVSVINTGLTAEGNTNSYLDISGSAQSIDTTGNIDITLEVVQKASLPKTVSSLEVWWVEKKRTYSWVRLDTVYNRAVDKAFSDDFVTSFKGDIIYNNTFRFKIPEEVTIPFVESGMGFFVAMVTDKQGYIVNTCRIEIPKTITIINENSQIPENFRLIGNYPNPFNPTTRFQFYIPANGEVGLTIYSITGQKIFAEKRVFSAGKNHWDWNGAGFASGVYYSVITFKSKRSVRPIILLK